MPGLRMINGVTANWEFRNFHIPKKWALPACRKSGGTLANFQVSPKLRRRGRKFKGNMTTVRLNGYNYALQALIVSLVCYH
jgi:hypothetical protein